jgi:hypothetical protein
VHEIRYGNRRCRTRYHDCHGYNRELPSASPKVPEKHRPSLNANTVDKELNTKSMDSRLLTSCDARMARFRTILAY